MLIETSVIPANALRMCRRGGRHWAIVATLIQTAKLNHVEPLAWLTDVLERIVTGRTKQNELATLLPWNWKADKVVEAPSTA